MTLILVPARNMHSRASCMPRKKGFGPTTVTGALSSHQTSLERAPEDLGRRGALMGRSTAFTSGLRECMHREKLVSKRTR